MPELDRLKEQVAYFKFWQGIVVLTDISLLGWLISAVDEADRLRTFLALLGVVVLTLGAVRWLSPGSPSTPHAGSSV